MKQGADIDIIACRNYLRRRQEGQRQVNRQLWEQAKADANAIIRHIVRTRKPKQVLQWGSVLHPEHFTPRSDIDIAIDGDFTAEDWFALVGELWQMTDFSLDLINLRRIEPEFAEIIRMKGKVVYDRDQSSD